MEYVIRAVGLAVIGSLLAVFLRKYDGAFALLVTLACATAILLLAMQLVEPILDFLRTLQDTAGISNPILAPLLKTVAIGLLTGIAANVCEDTGNKSAGTVVQLMGTVAAIYIALPLMQAVLELITSLMGGE